jgi:DNA-binding transcriptional MerR regulator
MATVGDMASAFGVTPQTIRSWCSEFQAFLSPGATPPAGQARNINEDDIRVLALVARMRGELASYEAIGAALDSGQRADLPEPEIDEPPHSGALVTRLTATLARYEGELEAVREERDYLRGQLTESQQREREALERAARAEAVHQALQDREAPQQATERPTEPHARPWWKRLLRE